MDLAEKEHLFRKNDLFFLEEHSENDLEITHEGILLPQGYEKLAFSFTARYLATVTCK
jgi:hypothetical protein